MHWLPCLLLLFLSPGCGPGEPTRVELEQLARFQSEFDGRWVATEGRLRMHESPRHFWIEDDALHRVEVRADEEPASLVGRRVRVVGRFSYHRERGRAIRVARLEAIP